MRMFLAVLLLVVTTAGRAAEGNPMVIESGRDLYVKCTALREIMTGSPAIEGDRVVLSAACLNYIDGFRNGHVFTSAHTAQRNKKGAITGSDVRKAQFFCASANVTNTELVDAALSYLNKRPEKRDSPAGLVLMIALREAFPCPRQ